MPAKRAMQAKRVFQVGDVCRIREWDDMAAEFGNPTFPGGSIPVQFTFTELMRPLCGRQFTVKSIFGSKYYSEEGVENQATIGQWNISADMLELVSDGAPEDLGGLGDFPLFD